MSALLTDEAVRASWGITDGRRVVPHPTVDQLLRFHATEGREALVAKMWSIRAADGEPVFTTRGEAEAVVTALVGERP